MPERTDFCPQHSGVVAKLDTLLQSQAAIFEQLKEINRTLNRPSWLVTFIISTLVGLVCTLGVIVLVHGGGR